MTTSQEEKEARARIAAATSNGFDYVCDEYTWCEDWKLSACGVLERNNNIETQIQRLITKWKARESMVIVADLKQLLEILKG